MTRELSVTVDFLKNKGITGPEIGIILGTGLGKMVEKIQTDQVISYDEIPNFPVATVEFHHGKLIYGQLEGRQVLAMQGRFHYYEGYNLQQITFHGRQDDLCFRQRGKRR